MRLKECGYERVSACRLKNHNIIMSHTVHFNKCYNFLPHNLNVLETIALRAGIELSDSESFVYSEHMPLKNVHLAVTRIFLRQRLNITDHKVSLLIRRIPALKNRSIDSIRQTIDLLEHKLAFPIDRIANSNLLNAHNSTAKELVEMQQLFNVDVRDLISVAPQILKIDIVNIIEIKQLIQRHSMPPFSVAIWKKIFAMHPDTLKANLSCLHQMKIPFDIFEHPIILKLAHNLNVVKKRLDAHNSCAKATQVSLEDFVE